MKRGAFHTCLLKLASHSVSAVLRASKDEHHVHGFILKQVAEQRLLQMHGDFIDELRDGLGWI